VLPCPGVRGVVRKFLPMQRILQTLTER
jgi:hypothetical protein